ncbi:hypothetical protein O1R50_23970 [Glycomyces luteolus]|uniref:Carboxylesterase family protein n=1 Tax=Glycomyces luteolus TaxID=2670330 RepID=A0A9X3STT9_9ACTN|nr:hypothetical protein [Glycomyces luteolus]MDA1362699.1 hypothetical protein [Glycomyces luteolus]
MFLTDAVYRLPATRLAVAQTAAGGRTHTYLLAAEPMGPQMGACHGADLMMLFGRIDPHRHRTGRHPRRPRRRR